MEPERKHRVGRLGMQGLSKELRLTAKEGCAEEEGGLGKGLFRKLAAHAKALRQGRTQGAGVLVRRPMWLE